MTPEEAATFSEPDENPAEVFAWFEKGPHGVTAPRLAPLPHSPGGPLCRGWSWQAASKVCPHASCWSIAADRVYLKLKDRA